MVVAGFTLGTSGNVAVTGHAGSIELTRTSKE